ncbi:hypothetical protein Ciccas_008919 [Cichlidogyrus casuarinus]|uniref:Uncharacterized protein n=1 Tax=Cichlidogyrus casuarinus TaxID=1844966 RepID=A0ABD2Q198_9PLAT
MVRRQGRLVLGYKLLIPDRLIHYCSIQAHSDVAQVIRQRILLRKRKELRKFQNDIPDSTTGSLSDLSPNPLPSDKNFKIPRELTYI